jgi:hypothetical protein
MTMTVKIRRRLSRDMYHYENANRPNRPYVFLVQSADQFAVEVTLTKAFTDWQQKAQDPQAMSIAWAVHPESVFTKGGLQCPENCPPELVGSFLRGQFTRPS